jgi:hypothetical protein
MAHVRWLAVLGTGYAATRSRPRSNAGRRNQNVGHLRQMAVFAARGFGPSNAAAASAFCVLPVGDWAFSRDHGCAPPWLVRMLARLTSASCLSLPSVCSQDSNSAVQLTRCLVLMSPCLVARPDHCRARGAHQLDRQLPVGCKPVDASSRDQDLPLPRAHHYQPRALAAR